MSFRPILFSFAASLILTSTMNALEQGSSPPPQPTDPTVILKLLTDANGLSFDTGSPWHIKLTYDQFDDDGDNIHSGIFEEYYAGPKKYKVSFSSDVLTQTDVATETGLYRSGDSKWIGPLELQVQNEVFHPVRLSERWSRQTKLDTLDWQVGNSTLPCIVARRTDMTISDNGLPKFCFDHGSLRLRYTRGKGWDQTLYNDLVLFQGRTVGRDITIFKGGKAHIQIHVETLEPVVPTDAIFTPSENSTLLSGRVHLSSSILDDYVIKQGGLSGNGEHGKVHVHFVVGRDGQIIEADALDGPSSLQKSVLKTMRQYVFRPFTVLGEPFEVESSMEFQFQ